MTNLSPCDPGAYIHVVWAMNCFRGSPLKQLCSRTKQALLQRPKELQPMKRPISYAGKFQTQLWRISDGAPPGLCVVPELGRASSVVNGLEKKRYCTPVVARIQNFNRFITPPLTEWLVHNAPKKKSLELAKLISDTSLVSHVRTE